MRTQYSPTLQAQIVLKMLQEARPVTQIAAEYGMAPRMLHRWRQELLDQLPTVLADPAVAARTAGAQAATVKELYAQIGQLTTQRAWLKKIWPRP